MANIIYFKMAFIKDLSWLLHYKVYIGPSNIHGVGLFAVDDIKKGQTVFYYNTRGLTKVTKEFLREFGVKEQVIETLCRLYYNNEKEIIMKQDSSIHFVNYLNHNENANIIYRNGFYIAKNNIKANEELCINYLENGYHPELSFKEH